MANLTVETLLGRTARTEPAEPPAAAGDAEFTSALQAAVGRQQPSDATGSNNESPTSHGSGSQPQQDAPESLSAEGADAEGEQQPDDNDSAEISAVAIAASEVLEVNAAPADSHRSTDEIATVETAPEPTGEEDSQGDAASKVSRNIAPDLAVPDSPDNGAPGEDEADVAPAGTAEQAAAETSIESPAPAPRAARGLDAPAASPDHSQQPVGTDEHLLAANNNQPASQEDSGEVDGKANDAPLREELVATRGTAEHADRRAPREHSTQDSAVDQPEVDPRNVNLESSQEIAEDGGSEAVERVGRVEGAAEAKPSDAGPQTTLKRFALSRGLQPHSGPAESETTVEVDRPRFLQRVGGAIEAAERRGGAIRVRLSPPELGSLRIELAVKQGTLTATLETETSAARQVLLDNLPALRARLAEQEIRVEQFDVDVRRDGRHSPEGGDDRQQSQTDHRRRGERTASDSSTTAPSTTSPPGLSSDDPHAENLDVRI